MERGEVEIPGVGQSPHEIMKQKDPDVSAGK
jgi:hypothetical protein